MPSHHQLLAINGNISRLPVCKTGGLSTDGTASSLGARIAEWSLIVLGAVIIVGGVAGNSVTAYVQATERSHRGTTRFLMVFLALVDCAVLLLAVVRYWLTETIGLDIRDQHPVLCHLHQTVVATISDLAVYTLCGIGVERFILMAFPNRAGRLITVRNFSIVFGCVTAAIAVKNVPLAFFRFTTQCVQLPFRADINNETDTVRKPLTVNISELGQPPYESYQFFSTKCDFDRNFARWFVKLDFVTFLVIPYTVLLVCNIYIYAAMRRQRVSGRQQELEQQQQQQRLEMISTQQETIVDRDLPQQNAASRDRKPESIMRLLAVLTVIHICTTLPASTGQLLSVCGWLTHSESTRVTLDALKTLMFANNATNFLAYFVSSRAFRDRVLRCGVRGDAARVTLEQASLGGAQANSLRSEHEAVQARNGEQLQPLLQLDEAAGSAMVAGREERAD